MWKRNEFLFKPVLAQSLLAKLDYIVDEKCKKSKELTDLGKYERISMNIRAIAKSEFCEDRNIKVHFFGSRVIGLATDESDLDIFIELDNNFFADNKTSEGKQQEFFKMMSAIASNGNWLVTDYVLKTTIPIIKCVYRPMQLNCDISFVNGLSVCNSKLLQHLFCIQPQAVELYHSLRQWMKIQDFDHLKGYTMTLLVLFYLQQKGFMPSIRTVQQNLAEIKIDGWKCQFDPTRNLVVYQVKQIWSYKPLIKGFFQFYNKFNFYNQVISPYDGVAVNKIQYQPKYFKHEPEGLIAEPMAKVENRKNKYKRQRKRQRNVPSINKSKDFCHHFCFKGLFIAGPINRAKNCGVMDNADREQFIQLCKSSTEYFL